MSNDYRDPKFKSWLDSLQQESWQLELIISGFAIYGLFTAYIPLKIELQEAISVRNIYASIILVVAFIACSILLFNLLVHVILRGLWIGALGLRYVSGDIEFDTLNYRPKFDRFLRKRIVSFDKFIGRLEDYCSILFAISFLLIFFFISFMLLMIYIILTASYILSDDTGQDISSFREIIGITIILTIIFGGFLTLLDFLTQGLLKRVKWLAAIYYPVYRLFSLVTLSFLYRPLVYNFLDNKFGKRLLWFLIPAYACIIFVISLENKDSNFFNIQNVSSSSYYADFRNYEDRMTEDSNLPRVATISSKVVNEPFMKVFILHSERVENYITSMNPGIKPTKDRRGLQSSFQFTSNSGNQFSWNGAADSLRSAYVKTFNENYIIRVDSLVMPASFVVSTNKRDQLGFESYINIKNLDDGKHLLKVQRLFIKDKDTLKSTRITIPFWYFR